MKPVVIVLLIASALLTGCVDDPYENREFFPETTKPTRTVAADSHTEHDRPARPTRSTVSTADRRALTRYARDVINWTGDDLTGTRKALTKLATQSHARSIKHEFGSARGDQASSGVVEAIRPPHGKRRTWLVVTRERFTVDGSKGEPAYVVYLAVTRNGRVDRFEVAQ